MRRSLAGLFLFALTLGLLAVGGNTIYSALQDKWAKESKQKPHQERVFSVNVITAKAVNLVPVMTAFGEIRSQRTLDIRAASTGMIINLAPEFVEGGTVKSGADQAVLSRRQVLQAAEARQTRANTRLARQKINLTDGERHLADTKIQAKFSGSLSNVTVVQGALVTKNERLAQLVDAHALEVSFRLSTGQHARLLGPDDALIHGKIEVALDVLGVNMLATGRISRESAVVAEGLSGRLLFATLNDARGFRPGDFVTVRINEPELIWVVSLPAADTARTVLLVGPDGRLELQQVELLRKQGNAVIVRSDAILGREVVLARSPLLGAGIKVKVLRAGPEKPQGAQLLNLSDTRRARLVAFIETNKQMSKEAKARILTQLSKEMVPLGTVERIESRMGG